MMSKTAYVADTSYQVFNILNLVWHEQPEAADLYLCDYFTQAGSLSSKIGQLGLFRSITLFSPHEKQQGEGRLHWYIRHAVVYLRSEKTLRESIEDKSLDFSHYDVIYTCTMNYLAVCLLRENKKATLKLVEDGAGTYFSNTTRDSTSWRHRLFSRIFHTGADVLKPDCVYLYAPQMKQKGPIRLEALPRPDGSFLKMAQELFEIRLLPSKEDRPVIWLTHPDALEKSTEPADYAVAEALSCHADSVIVRKHPRDSREELYRAFEKDEQRVMWELLIPFLKIETRILIASCSTAQMTPKLLYGAEPIVIFLIRLYEEMCPRDWYVKMLSMIDEFRGQYSDPGKVYVPASMDELKDLLEELLR